MIELSEDEFYNVFKGRLLRRRNAVFNEDEVLDYSNCGKFFVIKNANKEEIENNIHQVYEELLLRGYEWENTNPPRIIIPEDDEYKVNTYVYFYKSPKIINRKMDV